MKKFIVRILAGIGAWVVIVALVGLISSMLAQEHVPEKVILEMNLDRDLAEQVSADPVSGFMLEKVHTTRDVVDALERAAEDERVVALMARIGDAPLGLAQIQEVRDAVTLFRTQGKPALVYADSLGGFGPGNGAYYLATAFEEIYLQPSGQVGLTGLMYESMFYQGTLEKLGLQPRFGFRGEYKNAVNLYTERKYTPPHKEAVQRIIDSQFGQLADGIAEARSIAADQVRSLIAQGPFLASHALEVNLVDGLAYRDEVDKIIEERIGKDASRLSLFKYLNRAGRPHTAGDSIALIYGTGIVQSGKSSYDPLFGGPSMGSETVASAFRDAVADDEVKAIIFRVDSPGGSPLASDTIWRETIRAKEAGKPVIVTMGNLAGSGGYFIAMAADKIVAQPGTITGSIGVFGGKMITAGLLEKIGISSDEVHTSPNATMWSSTRDFSPEQWTKFDEQLDWIYEDFTNKVAQGRGMTKEQVLNVARGRIWTGEDAKAMGLVDELGGFPTALRLAKEAAGIAPDADVHIRLFPPSRSFVETLIARLLNEEETEDSQAVGLAMRRTIQTLQPIARLAQDLGFTPHPGVLTMPEWTMGRTK